MGSIISNTPTNFVSFIHLNQDKTYQYPLNLTLKQVKQRLKKKIANNIYVYFKWTRMTQKDQKKTLSKIIEQQDQAYPHNKDRKQIFLLIDQQNPSKTSQLQKSIQLKNTNDRHDKIYEKLQGIDKIKSDQSPNFTTGCNGHYLFQGRQSAILASSVVHALNLSKDQQKGLQAFKLKLGSLKCNTNSQQALSKINASQAISNSNASQFISNSNTSQVSKVLDMLGVANNNLKQQQKQKMYCYLKQKLQTAKQFSDFDMKFLYYIAQIYLKFMIQSLGKIHYINYNNINDFQIAPIKSNAKIGIIGDFGTGLKDSILLLNNMVIKHNVDVIIHLGDVYYAGTPQQYQISITKPLNELRLKLNRQIRFYSIPGNHDYYTWGLPFLCFVKSINSQEFQKQKCSYFCLRDQLNRWQFLGMDTAFHDSNPANQFDPLSMGPYIRKQQLKWHKHRLSNFKGSTIVLTHHQLFSIHQRINGSLTEYRNFSCLNPMLCAQLFEYIPTISCWLWGHQHSYMLFKENVMGVQKGRLLGNSSYHVMYDKQNPYKRKKNYPLIPFIVDDKQYNQKYLPVNPNRKGQQFYALCYAVIDMQQIKQDNSLPMSYYCSPCFSDQKFQQISKSQQDPTNDIFDQYLIYQEEIYSIQRINNSLIQVKNKDTVYLRCQIGLMLAIKTSQNQQQCQFTYLNLSGDAFQIQIISQKQIKNEKQPFYIDFTLKQYNNVTKLWKYIGVDNNKIKYIHRQQESDPIFIWTCIRANIQNNHLNNSAKLRFGDIIQIQHKATSNILSWTSKNGEQFPQLEKINDNEGKKEKSIEKVCSFWTFTKQSLITQ